MRLFDNKDLRVAALSGQHTICSQEEARLVEDAGQIMHLNKGDIAAKQGDIGECLYYILSGSIEIKINGHHYKYRSKNEMVGEMAIIDPGARRSADMIAAEDDTYLFHVKAADFHRIASQNSELWRCIAVTLADRLRQRDEMFVPPNLIPVVFVASSSEAAKLHFETLLGALESETRELAPWTKPGIFRPTASTLSELEERANSADFAVVLVTGDDLQETSRGKLGFAARDNVTFEAGLFMGALEAKRVFLLVEKDADLSLPSDWNGITILMFSGADELLEKAKEIAGHIDDAGLLFRTCRPLA